MMSLRIQIFITYLVLLLLIKKTYSSKYYIYVIYVLIVAITFSPLFYVMINGTHPYLDYALWTNYLYADEYNVTKHIANIFSTVVMALSSAFMVLGVGYHKNRVCHISSVRLVRVSFFNLLIIIFLFTPFIMFSFYVGSSEGTIVSQGYASRLEGSSDNQNFLFVTQFLLTMLVSIGVFSAQKNIAKIIKYFTILLLVIWAIHIDILRGDRTSVGMVLAFLYMCSFSFERFGVGGTFSMNPTRKVIPIVATVAFISTLLQAVRSRGILMSLDSVYELLVKASAGFFFVNPWQGGYRQLVGQAALGDVSYGFYDVVSTYLVMFIPGPVRALLGMDSSSWIYDTTFYGEFTSGGTHPAVLYYEYFGYTGVLLVFIVMSYLVIFLENKLNKNSNYYGLFLGASFVSFLPRFIWYGHVYFIKYLSFVIPVTLVWYAVSTIKRFDDIGNSSTLSKKTGGS